MRAAEIRFSRCQLLELLGRQNAAQRVDRAHQRLGAAAAGDGILGHALGMGERLGLRVGCTRSRTRRGRGRLHHREHRVGEVAPRIELIGADANLGFEHAQLLRQRLGTRRRRPHVGTRHAAVRLVSWLVLVIVGQGSHRPGRRRRLREPQVAALAGGVCDLAHSGACLERAGRRGLAPRRGRQHGNRGQQQAAGDDFG